MASVKRDEHDRTMTKNLIEKYKEHLEKDKDAARDIQDEINYDDKYHRLNKIDRANKEEDLAAYKRSISRLLGQIKALENKLAGKKLIYESDLCPNCHGKRKG